MGRGRLVLLSFLGLILLAGVSGPTPPYAAAEPLRAERPTYAVGERWIRNDSVFELVRVEPDRYVYRFNSGPNVTEVHMSHDLSLMRVTRNGAELYNLDPPVPFAWPLEVGKEGKSTAVLRRASGDARLKAGITVDVTWAVEAEEEVAVPAGTFRTLRIIVRLTGPGYKGSNTLWYAPEARQFIRGRTLDGGTYEVVAVTTGKVAPPALPPPPEPGGNRWRSSSESIATKAARCPRCGTRSATPRRSTNS